MCRHGGGSGLGRCDTDRAFDIGQLDRPAQPGAGDGCQIDAQLGGTPPRRR
jgi:hypothetical protein